MNNKYNKIVMFGGKTKVITRYGVLSFSDSMKDKMAGMLSLSTSSLQNSLCLARMQNKNLICSHCYTEKSFRYPSVEPMYIVNTDILTNNLLSKNDIPKIYHPLGVVRLQALGETANVTEAINYVNIARYNRQTTFAIWTKNPGFFAQVFKTIQKPKNLIIIYSSIFVNVEQANIFDRFPFIDKIFTVYDKDYLKDHPEVNINCGSRKCLECLRCYKHNGTKFIHEKLK